ncbi:MAG: histidine kinase, partial [Bacteroidota bacterium]
MKMHHYLFLFLFLGLNMACERPTNFGYHRRVLKVGDDFAWAAKDYDDSTWEKRGWTEHSGIFWVRFKIDFGEQMAHIQHKGLRVISLGSYEAYWDGVLIGENGKVGETKIEEIPGSFISNLLVPDSLAHYGSHTLALRVSKYRSNLLPSWNTFYVNEYEYIVRAPIVFISIIYTLAGVFFIVGVYYLFLSINQKKKFSTLIFSLLCSTLFALITMEYLKIIYQYPYSFQALRLSIIGVLTFMSSYFCVLFFLNYFQIPSKNLLAWLAFFILILINIVDGFGGDVAAMNMSLFMLIASSSISIYAWIRRKTGAVLVFFTFLLITFINFMVEIRTLPFLYQYDVNLFISYTLIIITMLYLLAQQQKVDQKAYEESLLLSARLKNDLLKKNIQPHFIMNTLTSLIDWVEESPKEGVKFMEALAREFQLFSKMADQRLIPIEEEIELCKKHLEIMSYRKEINYQWKQSGIDENEYIPPAILHTILENGITHSLPSEEGNIRFLLQFEKAEKNKIYILSTFAKNRKSEFKKDKKSTGLNY